jgi:hypothetical protein
MAGRLTPFERGAGPGRDSVTPQANGEVRQNVSPPVNPSTPVSFANSAPHTPPSFDTSRDSIRSQLETERLDEAIRTIVDNLMAKADISE